MVLTFRLCGWSRGRCLVENHKWRKLGQKWELEERADVAPVSLVSPPLRWGFLGTPTRKACSRDYFQDKEGTHEQG